jgi:hypothetical protein
LQGLRSPPVVAGYNARMMLRSSQARDIGDGRRAQAVQCEQSAGRQWRSTVRPRRTIVHPRGSANFGKTTAPDVVALIRRATKPGGTPSPFFCQQNEQFGCGRSPDRWAAVTMEGTNGYPHPIFGGSNGNSGDEGRGVTQNPKNDDQDREVWTKRRTRTGYWIVAGARAGQSGQCLYSTHLVGHTKQ